MRHLNLISLLLTAAGILLVVGGTLLDLSPALTLVGLMLVIGGVVKVATLKLWRGLFEPEPPADR